MASLGVAVVLWPALSQLVPFGQRILPVHQLQVLAIMSYARHVVGLAFLFVAVFYLSKTKPAERVV